MIVSSSLALIFIVGGLFFLFVSSLGMMRMPDFYTRCHAVSKSETLGSMLMLFGLAIFNGFNILSMKLLVILLFVFLANPLATHVMAQAAYRCGLQPWSLKQPQEGKRINHFIDCSADSDDVARDDKR